MLFWPEISALGVFFNVDSERMRPLNTQVPPRGMTSLFKSLPIMHRLDGQQQYNHSNPGTPGSYFKQYLAEAPCFPAKSRPPPLPGIQLTGA